jgi:heme exporter protein D
MEKLTEVLAMGGYGAFVWPSYAAAAVILFVVFIISRRRLAKAKQALHQLEVMSGDET